MAVVFCSAGMLMCISGCPTCSWNAASDCHSTPASARPCIRNSAVSRWWMCVAGRAGAHLVVVDGTRERVAAGFHERRADLPRDAFECRIGHRKLHVGPREVVQRRDALRIAGAHHDRQLVRHVRHGRADERAVRDQPVDLAEPAKYASGLTVHVMLPTVIMPPAWICFTSRPGGIVSSRCGRGTRGDLPRTSRRAAPSRRNSCRRRTARASAR